MPLQKRTGSYFFQFYRNHQDSNSPATLYRRKIENNCGIVASFVSIKIYFIPNDR